MALLKTGYVTSAGVKAEYWTITDYKTNKQMKYVDITMCGWLDEASYVSDFDMIDTPKKVRCLKAQFDVYFSTEILNGTGVNMTFQMYKFAKENNEFFMSCTDLLDTTPSEPTETVKSLAESFQEQIDATNEAVNFMITNY